VLFVVDAQLPPLLCEFFVRRGHLAEHVLAALSLNATDRDVWKYATRKSAVIVTKDEDFTYLSDQSDGAQLVWIRLGNTRNRNLLERLASVWDDAEAALVRGERVVQII
jgi:predicted nuclease of predicted toxin-antitoxin system